MHHWPKVRGSINIVARVCTALLCLRDGVAEKGAFSFPRFPWGGGAMETCLRCPVGSWYVVVSDKRYIARYAMWYNYREELKEKATGTIMPVGSWCLL